MRTTCGKLLLASMALAAVDTPAWAGLIGDSIGGDFLITPAAPSSLPTHTVQPSGTTFVFGSLSFTFTDTQLTIQASTGNSFTAANRSFFGPQFTDQTSPFTSATENAATTVPGFTPSDIVIDSNGVLSVNLATLQFVGSNQGTPTSIVLDIDQSTDVPEPVSMSLLGGGLLGLAAMRRRPG